MNLKLHSFLIGLAALLAGTMPVHAVATLHQSANPNESAWQTVGHESVISGTTGWSSFFTADPAETALPSPLQKGLWNLLNGDAYLTIDVGDPPFAWPQFSRYSGSGQATASITGTVGSTDYSVSVVSRSHIAFTVAQPVFYTFTGDVIPVTHTYIADNPAEAQLDMWNEATLRSITDGVNLHSTWYANTNGGFASSGSSLFSYSGTLSPGLYVLDFYSHVMVSATGPQDVILHGMVAHQGELTLTPVPEPSAMVLTFLFTASLTTRRKR